MAKKIAAPAAARPVLSDEEQAAAHQAWKLRRIRIILEVAMENHKDAKDRAIGILGNDYELSWDYLGRLTVAREIAHLLLSRYGAEWAEKTNEELLSKAPQLLEDLMDRVLRTARGAHTSGDLNSTDQFSRAISAAKLSAQAELIDQLKALLS